MAHGWCKRCREHLGSHLQVLRDSADFRWQPGCSSIGELMSENGPFLWQPGVFKPIKNKWSYVSLGKAAIRRHMRIGSRVERILRTGS